MAEFARWPVRKSEDEELTRASSSAEIELAASGEVSPKSELKGKLLDQIEKSKRRDSQELSALRGSLVNEKATEYEPFTIEWLNAQTFIQRDSGVFFTIKDVNSDKKPTLVTLENTVLKRTVTLRLDDFIQKLKAPESPWRVK